MAAASTSMKDATAKRHIEELAEKKDDDEEEEEDDDQPEREVADSKSRGKRIPKRNMVILSDKFPRELAAATGGATPPSIILQVHHYLDDLVQQFLATGVLERFVSHEADIKIRQDRKTKCQICLRGVGEQHVIMWDHTLDDAFIVLTGVKMRPVDGVDCSPELGTPVTACAVCYNLLGVKYTRACGRFNLIRSDMAEVEWVELTEDYRLSNPTVSDYERSCFFADLDVCLETSMVRTAKLQVKRRDAYARALLDVRRPRSFAHTAEKDNPKNEPRSYYLDASTGELMVEYGIPYSTVQEQQDARYIFRTLKSKHKCGICESTVLQEGDFGRPVREQTTRYLLVHPRNVSEMCQPSYRCRYTVPTEFDEKTETCSMAKKVHSSSDYRQETFADYECLPAKVDVEMLGFDRVLCKACDVAVERSLVDHHGREMRRQHMWAKMSILLTAIMASTKRAKSGGGILRALVVPLSRLLVALR